MHPPVQSTSLIDHALAPSEGSTYIETPLSMRLATASAFDVCTVDWDISAGKIFRL